MLFSMQLNIQEQKNFKPSFQKSVIGLVQTYPNMGKCLEVAQSSLVDTVVVKIVKNKRLWTL